MRKIFLMMGFVLALVAGACSPSSSIPEAQSSEDEMMSEEEAMESDEEEMESEEMTSDESMAEGEETGDETMDDAMISHAEFTVRVENIAGDDTILLAPGAWVLFSEGEPIFVAEEPDRDLGLEALAEDGDPSGLSASLGDYMGVVESGLFNTPSGASEPGPLGPGGTYEFEFKAEDGQSLAFATMYVQSNDLFYAPAGSGIDLFDEEGRPLEGDITGFIFLWDAGTEVNQAPGEGADQPPRQAGSDTGEDEMGVLHLVDDGFAYPKSVIRVTINAMT